MSDTNTVMEQVEEQIKTIGANTEQNITELRSNLNELRKEIDKHGDNVNSELKAKLDKYSADIATRQEAIDKEVAELKAKDEANQKAMEQMDLMLQRHGHSGDGNDSDFEKNLKHFALSTIPAGQVKDVGPEALEQRMDELRGALPEYQKAFEHMLRVRGDERQLSADCQKALSVGSDPDGGWSVTPSMNGRIIERIYEISPIRQLASAITISTDSLKGMADYFDTTDTKWATETISNSNTDTPKMGEYQIYVHELESRPRATQQLLEDSAVNIEQWLSRKVANKMARVEATAFINGDGTGKPRGILTYANGSSWGQIEQIAMGHASQLTGDGFTDVKYGLKEDYLNRGTWLMNRLTVAEAMKLKDGNGAYLWKPSMIAGDPSSTILGAPVRMATDMPEVAANALSVIYADFAETYQIVDRLGITLMRDPYTAKPFVEFYFRKRLGGDVVNFESIKIGKISA